MKFKFKPPLRKVKEESYEAVKLFALNLRGKAQQNDKRESEPETAGGPE